MIVLIVYVQPETILQLTAASTMDDVWTAQMVSFVHHAQATLKFAKKIPGKCQLLGVLLQLLSCHDNFL